MDTFRVLAESLPHMVWTCAADGACDYLSPQWVEYTGSSAAEQLGYGWLERLHPDDVEVTKRRWQEAAERGSSFDTEFRIRRADGVHRWFKTRAVATRDEDGRILRWYGSNTDIQDLRDAQEAADDANRSLEQRVRERTAELDGANLRLRKVASQLQAAQRIARVGSWELDVATGEVIWSAELYHSFGLSADTPAPAFTEQEKLFDAPSWALLTAAVTRAVEEGVPYEITLAARRSDDTSLTSIAIGEPIRGPDGAVAFLVGTLQDISARAERDRELARVSDRLRLATSAARIGVWEWDIPTDRLEWDSTMYELYGVARDGRSLTVEAWSERLHPADADRVQSELARARGGGKPFDTTFRVVTPEGRVKHLRSAATFHRDARGATERMIGVNWDVSEQVEAERSLRDVEALQRALLLHVGPAMIATTVEGTITIFNRSAEALLGHSARDLVGKATPLLFHDADEVRARGTALEQELGIQLDTPFDTFVAKARLGQTDANEWTYVRKDGRRVSVLLTITAIRLESGELVGYLGIAVDLSQQKAEERALLELNRQLVDRKAQMEVLLKEIHHRVKNNLQIIASLVNMQGRQAKEDATRAALGECRTRILAIALVHEQLYQSKDYTRIPFYEYVERLARHVIAATGSQAPIRVTFELEKLTLPVESAIPCGLILNELLTNAFKHAFPDGRRGTVTVSLSRREGQIELAVTDDGVGLPGDFDVDRAGSLGVVLVRDLCAQLGGTMHVSGQGKTRFAVTFPSEASDRPT